MINSAKSRILCIDDDTHTSDWIKIMLRGANLGCSVTTVKTGREAFKLLNSEKFDLCILEYALPDMTGVQLCSLMRQMGCDVPMMFFTAMNRQIDRDKAAAAGASDFLCKPDDLDVFVDAVTHLVRRRRAIYAAEPRTQQYARAA